MEVTMRFLLIAAVLLAAPAAATAGDIRVERIDIVDAGIYTVATGEETADPDAPTGTIAAPTTATLVEATTAIPGRRGLEFGLRYVIVGEPAGAEVSLDFVIAYPAPGLVDPAEPEPLRESRFTRPKQIGETIYLGYGFENDWEIVPGEWRFEIWYEGSRLAERRFAVTD
jgi:hypothetical protein